MIVNKPQFDTTKIKPGQAYWLTKKDYRHYNTISAPCIIQKVEPLGVTVNYWDEKNQNMAMHHIAIDDVVNETFKLQPMIIEELKGKKADDSSIL